MKGESSMGEELKSPYGVSYGEVRYSPKLCDILKSGEALMMSISGCKSDSSDGAVGIESAGRWKSSEDESGMVDVEDSSDGVVDNMFK